MVGSDLSTPWRKEEGQTMGDGERNRRGYRVEGWVVISDGKRRHGILLFTGFRGPTFSTPQLQTTPIQLVPFETHQN
jgi:hypothetical protein